MRSNTGSVDVKKLEADIATAKKRMNGDSCISQGEKKLNSVKSTRKAVRHCTRLAPGPVSSSGAMHTNHAGRACEWRST